MAALILLHQSSLSSIHRRGAVCTKDDAVWPVDAIGPD